MSRQHYERYTKKFRQEKRWYRPLEYAKRRCSDKNHKEFPYYGGRGIKCSLTFDEARLLYYRDRGDNLRKPSLDRIDPDGPYSFENCQYIEHEENIKKRRPNGTVKKEEMQTCSVETEAEKEWEE